MNSHRKTTRPTKVQNCSKTGNSIFFTKAVFLSILNGIWEVWGCPGAWHEPYDAIPRTLAGFGLTWHGGNRFSCFFEILETHFITKYLQIGHRASGLVLVFFCQGIMSGGIKINKCPNNDLNKQKKLGNWTTSPNHIFL